MARDFSKNTSNYMSLGINTVNPILSGASKVAIHCWAYLDTKESLGTIGDDVLAIAMTDAVSGLGVRFTAQGGGTPSEKVRIQARSTTGESAQLGDSTTTLSTGQWYAVGGLIDFGNDRIYIYINGTLETTAVVTFTGATYTPGTPTTWHDSIGCVMTVGGSTPLSTARQVDGRIAEVALWKLDSSASFGANEFAALYRGRLAWDVQPTNLVFYAPLWGIDTNEYDLKGKLTGTITGTVAKANHAPVTPFGRRLWGASTPLIEVAAATSPYYFRRYILGRRG